MREFRHIENWSSKKVPYIKMAGLRFSSFLGRKVPYIEVPYIGIRL